MSAAYTYSPRHLAAYESAVAALVDLGFEDTETIAFETDAASGCTRVMTLDGFDVHLFAYKQPVQFDNNDYIFGAFNGRGFGRYSFQCWGQVGRSSLTADETVAAFVSDVKAALA